MEFVRTPDERFYGLEDYPFKPNYLKLNDFEGGQLRLHYLDEGEKNGETVLLLHGEPSWSFLYRTMIPVLAQAGFRVLAPDLIGFGKSDKPTRPEDYTYSRHVGWVKQFIDLLELKEITLFGQDWGGLIGLRLAAENEARFSRIAIGNTGLPTGDVPLSEGLKQWQSFSQSSPDFQIGKVIAHLGAIRDLSDAAKKGYDAPFPSEEFKAGARHFPQLIPDGKSNPEYDAQVAAWRVLEAWQKPFLTAFSDGDFSTKAGNHTNFQKRVPGADGQSHTIITGAGHFLQEQVGPQLAKIIVNFIRANP